MFDIALKIITSLLTTAALGLCGYFWKKVRELKKLVDCKKAEEFDERIEEKLEPIVAEIEELRAYVRTTEETEHKHIALIVSSYKYRLVQLCKLYIKQGFMTQDQYDQLSEFYKLYRALGGNGQAEEYWNRVQKLDIK